MSWIYKISQHSLFFQSTDGNTLVTSQCYCGFPPHVNDPAFCAVSNVGPLPPGGYMIRDFADHPMLGVLAAYLDPSAGNSMYGRGGFYMHGDSSAHPGEASHGCIILPHDTRVMLSESDDRSLLVVR